MKRLLDARLVVFSLLAGCGAGIFASAPWIEDADYQDVVFVGDSIFALSGEIQDVLHDEAGGTFRNYTTSGAELNGGLLAPSVRTQFDWAMDHDSSSSIVVMDGGGNDILIPATGLGDPYGCKTTWYRRSMSSRCRSFIDDIQVEVTDLLDDMAADGITDVIYLGYYYPVSGSLGASSLGDAVDYGDDAISDACDNSVVDCTFIDPRGVIGSSDIVSDGVHPSTSGSEKLAALIWPELEPLLP